MSYRAPMPEERIKLECDQCGAKGTFVGAHYDRVRCACGKAYWALRPQRGGPLVAFPWPGTPEMRRYQEQQEAA